MVSQLEDENKGGAKASSQKDGESVCATVTGIV